MSIKNRNICKFPSANILNDLRIVCFVLETNRTTMTEVVTLSSNRMILIEQGNGVFCFDGIHHSFSAGSLIFGFEGESFCLTEGTDVSYLYIDFTGQRGQNLCTRFGISPNTRSVDKQNSLIPFFKNCLFDTPQEHIDLAAESVLLYVFSQLTNECATQNSVLQRIIEITDERFGDPGLSIGTIACELGYNSKYLSHFFKEKMKVSYSEYIRSIRFKYAISLFKHGVDSIKNVSYLCGYTDPLFFSASFKKEIGVSPKEFIARLGK